MRFVLNFGRLLLVGLLACSLAMQLSLRADEPTVKSANATGKTKTTPAADLPYFSIDLDLQFPPESSPKPLPAPKLVEDETSAFPSSSRRSRSWPLPLLRDNSPALFFPDEDRPVKPLTGQFSENPIWRADYVESWGAHPATPVPSRTPHWGVLINDLDAVIQVGAEEEIDASREKSVYAEKCEKCGKCTACKCENCPGKGCKASESQSQHGEAAKVILELMETLGRSVLDGTVFQKEDKQEHEWLKELSADGLVSPREALIQYIRMLEAQENHARSRQVEVEEEEECLLFCEHGLVSCPAKCQDCPVGCAACPAGCAACPAASRGCTASAEHAPCLGEGPRQASSCCGKWPSTWKWPPTSWSAARCTTARTNSAKWPARCARMLVIRAWPKLRTRQPASARRNPRATCLLNCSSCRKRCAARGKS